MRSLCLSAALTAVLYAPTQSLAFSADNLLLHSMGSLPAYLYDPDSSQIPRRRPGHPVPERSEPEIINPDNTDPAPIDAVGDFIPVPDRWRIMESLGFKFPWYDPYNQNVWKGDKPIHGDDWFLSLLAISDTIMEPRSVPTPVGPQASLNPGAFDIFSGPDQTIFASTLLAGIIYFKGDTVFKPPEWEYRLTLAFNYNRVDVDDVRALEIDPRGGNTRIDGFLAVQEAFIDRHLNDVGSRYDFDAIRIGIQPFSTDFRGFLFQDLQMGVRLFGNRDNNRRQYNLAWFRRVEKDTNSGLNDIEAGLRDDDTFVANYYWQDFGFLGLTSQWTFVYNRNRDTKFFFDDNGFIARPASLGLEKPREYTIYYLGYNVDGKIDWLNISGSFYYAHGKNDAVFVERETDVRAGFAALELSRDFDWIRPRLSLLWASGDSDPFDGQSNGFDAIFENPLFAGGDTSYWVRQNLPFVGGGGVTLAGRNSILPALRSSKELGQSNFDNPGIRLVGVGADFDLTPQSRVSVNLNRYWFDETAVLELARNQGPIDRSLGTDLSVAWIWRPFMTQNAVVRLSGAVLDPGRGLADLYGDDDRYYSVLGNFIFTY
jgi:hypothetical protein